SDSNRDELSITSTSEFYPARVDVDSSQHHANRSAAIRARIAHLRRSSRDHDSSLRDFKRRRSSGVDSGFASMDDDDVPEDERRPKRHRVNQKPLTLSRLAQWQVRNDDSEDELSFI